MFGESSEAEANDVGVFTLPPTLFMAMLAYEAADKGMSWWSAQSAALSLFSKNRMRRFR